MINIKNN